MNAPVASVVRPKCPDGNGWREFRVPAVLSSLGYPARGFFHEETRMAAISAVEVAIEPGQPELGPEYHISITRDGERCSSSEALWVLAQFRLLDAKEDNHTPGGKARNFWRPVADKLSGYECPCTDEEPAVREDKGDFVWRGITR